MRTLQEIEKDLEEAQNRLEPIAKLKEEIEEEVRKYRRELREYHEELDKARINNGLYYSMNELTKYVGQKISKIKLVKKDQDGLLQSYIMSGSERFNVAEDGYLFYFSLDWGIMQFDEEYEKYVWFYYGEKTYYDFVGFLEIEFEEE